MTQEISTNILVKAAECFDGVRKRIAEGMAYLYEISEKKLWEEGGYGSFGEFCEGSCGISASFGSKLVKVYEHFVVNGKLSQRKLGSVDAEKLYLATSLPGTPDKQLVKAETWTRQEIRDELASGENGDCGHEEKIMICKRCGKRV